MKYSPLGIGGNGPLNTIGIIDCSCYNTNHVLFGAWSLKLPTGIFQWKHRGSSATETDQLSFAKGEPAEHQSMVNIR